MSVVSVVFSGTGLCRVDHSSRGIIPGGATLSVIYKPRELGRLGPLGGGGGCCAKNKQTPEVERENNSSLNMQTQAEKKLCVILNQDPQQCYRIPIPDLSPRRKEGSPW
jgi:hypothetical protein